MLIDEAFITLVAGKGGSGNVSFFPGGKGGPCGGAGGRGGNIYVKTNDSLTSLVRYSSKTKYEADRGRDGDTFNKTGADGSDLVLEFPVGTELIDHETKKVIALPENGQMLLVCSGGRGGWGNDHFKSSINRTPRQMEPGFVGEKKTFKVIMRLIAHIGLIGLPNVGKSSLLNTLTKSQAKIADYPFTTLEPNLGALGKTIMADIPGLIEGASSGRGLGTKFLKHIEKVHILLHCISIELDTKQMMKNYEVVRKELAAYNDKLLEKPEIIILTRSDLILPKEREKKIAFFKKKMPEVWCVSIHDADSLEKLSARLSKV